MKNRPIHRRGSVVLLLAALFALLHTPNVLVQEAAPKSTRPLGHYRGPIPQSTRQLWDAAQVVAVFRVESEQTPVGSTPCPLGGDGWTHYRVHVSRVFKGADLVRQAGNQNELWIRRTGCKVGDAMYDAVLFDGYAPFGIGEEYVGFLRRYIQPYDSFFVPAYSGVGVYVLKAGVVENRSDEPIAKRQRGRRANDFLKELGDLAKEPGGKH